MDTCGNSDNSVEKVLLEQLRQRLESIGLGAEAVDAAVLFPGSRRERLLRLLMSRLLGGRDVDSLQTHGSLQLHDGLAGDEVFAERCRILMSALGVAASTAQIRGCSGSRAQDTAPLLQLAELTHAVSQTSPVNDTAGGSGTAPQLAVGAVPQLLERACADLARLTNANLQLFASDMSEVLRTYSEQGALQQLQRRRQAVAAAAAVLRGELQQLGAACEGAHAAATGAEWNMADLDKLDAALGQLKEQTEAFGGVWQRELSVWAESADEQVPGSGADGPAGADGLANALAAGDIVPQAAGSSARGVGLAARHIMGAYAALQTALEGFQGVMAQHQTLQGVPVDMLQEHSAAHRADARRLANATAVLQQAAVAK